MSLLQVKYLDTDFSPTSDLQQFSQKQQLQRCLQSLKLYFTLLTACCLRVVLMSYPSPNRPPDWRNRSGDHQKSRLQCQKACRQEPGTHAAHHQGNPEGFLQAIQRETGQSAAEQLLPVGDQLQALKEQVTFCFLLQLQVKNHLWASQPPPLSSAQEEESKKKIHDSYLNYFLSYKKQNKIK